MILSEVRDFAALKSIIFVSPPRMRLKRVSDDTTWKPSIPDAIKGVFLDIGDINNVTNKYEDFSKVSYNLIGSCPPVIGITNEKKYFVIVEGIYYPTDTIRDSIQMLFKIFYVYNLTYPSQCVDFYHFIQEYFYEIGTDQKTSEISSLITQLSMAK